MTIDRDLHWPGSFNTRDLGGLPTVDGAAVRRGALVRSATLEFLTTEGWASLRRHGVRTVIDLTDGVGHHEYPLGIDRVHCALDPTDETEFWSDWDRGLHCTPLYYRAFLERFPNRIGGVLRAIVGARPGGVLVHCGGGRDRTGLVVLVALRCALVRPEEIGADYALTRHRIGPLYAKHGMTDESDAIARILAEHGTTAEETVTVTAESLDLDHFLPAAGISDQQLDALRIRLREPVDTSFRR